MIPNTSKIISDYRLLKYSNIFGIINTPIAAPIVNIAN